MTLGTAIKKQIEAIIDNVNFRSTVSVTPKTPTAGSFGGYEAGSENALTAFNINAVPSQFFKDRLNFLGLGNLSTGDMRLVIKSGETLDNDDKVTFQSTAFDIAEIRDIPFNDVIVAKVLILTKRL